MRARFLLGPAGSGKTFRCLAEIRTALASAPGGPPLILLAPKQATFQLERQLLAGPEISGFTRLHIFSFDKLARFILEQLQIAPPKMLSREGRVMVLRALLMRRQMELKLFGRSARRPGFAAELSALLSELQQHQFTAAKLRALAETKKLRPELQNKLRDLALISEAYADWLAGHELQDADGLLTFTTEALRAAKIHPANLKIENLFLDGFAEMTPQELDLLAAVVPLCENATLAFCLESASADESSRLSLWSAINKTFQQCRARLENLPGVKIEITTLARESQKNRFAENAELAALEKNWARPLRVPSENFQNRKSKIKIAACANPEAEAVFAAREILKFVRANQRNRFRDCAVLVRTLDNYHQPLARIFRRYEIPFFLDRREAVAHHPLAELTRGALRTVTFDWQHDDWFSALKSGFLPVAETEIDRLENAALEFGWRGQKWREPPTEKISFAPLLAEIFPPFEKIFTAFAKINFRPTGEQLTGCIRALWRDLNVEKILERWARDGEKLEMVARKSAVHATVFEQMNLWLENLALAFPRESMELRDWLPVLEAGLANLTVGVVPPALDQVLVGAIDRARNPDLKFTLLLGVNETIFPTTPAAPVILTNADRDDLENQNAALGANVFDQISRERFLGYIACTRASEQLAVIFSRQSAAGKNLNPSPFIAQLQFIFPALEIESFSGAANWNEAEQASELMPSLVELQNLKSKTLRWETLLELPALKSLAEKLAQLRAPDLRENLSPAVAEKLYGATLHSSVSRLEEFAQCPFRFFIRSGLRAGERKRFELDARERGNFQHDVLKNFHEQLQAEGRRWRDLTPAEARERISVIAAAQMKIFRDGLLRDSGEAIFSARMMAASLQDFVEVIVTWMRGQYEFDPAHVELGFGKNTNAPPWEIGLSDGHRLALQGRIDRVDLWRDANDATALAVVMDYKSGGKKLDPLLVENGVQLQLLAYLGALRRWKNPREFFGVETIIPAGAFYLNLRGTFETGETRDEILWDTESKSLAYRHSGRFDAEALRKFDRRREVTKGDQFNFRLNKAGDLPSNSTEAISRADFYALLDQVEEQLRTLGEKIFSGAAAVDPYRKGSATACDFCDYRAACRLDPWTHSWRVLRTTKTQELT